ncbi:3-hydroxyisobutyrate dehydrogenase-like beta-hydroxyacid dehydrogenase [Nocardia tenerifensis]|uniref:3-hydroxyisobutyrate dehydrogenase-like beta-hydroxyacid dehydrogenase n=1 Tax=Nocardia tenerifensis TaxID=228006 RepID=A0A318JUY3_9NOCA|nr:NAD(P)-binding domain-containing protein [Nocardia tenerifensis]PXX57498.1 3-hydroxyisobutyrate dehydrogenase-like beta-hydroxyacid dehydrogenase [Nocardia tenerifensis]
MAETKNTPVTVLGLGAMGQALAATLLRGGHPTTVWNRTPGKDTELIAAGAVGAATAAEAVEADGPVIVVLFDHASVHAILDPLAGKLSGRQVINLTSTAPEQARELAAWAAGHGIDYLDGGIMAVPSMIGQPGASILYSGSRAVYDKHRETLELLAAAEYFGDDAGLASTYDFALLAGMYAMFGGFMHGAAMMRSVGVSAGAFADRAASWVTAMAQMLPAYGRIIDGGDYTSPIQSLDFHKAALDAITRATRDAGVAVDFVAPIKNLIDRQVADGHGSMEFARTIEELV